MKNKKPTNEAPSIEEILRYENGEFESFEELRDFFQRLINSGLVWKLQGSYGRAAAELLKSGACTLPNK